MLIHRWAGHVYTRFGRFVQGQDLHFGEGAQSGEVFVLKRNIPSQTASREDSVSACTTIE